MQHDLRLVPQGCLFLGGDAVTVKFLGAVRTSGEKVRFLDCVVTDNGGGALLYQVLSSSYFEYNPNNRNSSLFYLYF